MPVDTTFYDILGVAVNATTEQIAKAYRQKARDCHPDHGGDAETMQKLNAAKEVLLDPKKRQIYDQHGLTDLQHSPDFSTGFPDIFDWLINKQRHSHQPTVPKGSDITHPLKVSLEELYSGKTKNISVDRQVVCDDCRGTGCKDQIERECTKCEGNGIEIVTLRQGLFIQQMQRQCSACNGQGTMISPTNCCNNCRGNKTIRQTKTLEVNIPHGSSHGETIRFIGEGNQIPKGENGTLYVILQQEAHLDFQRVNDNLLMKLTINLSESLCGFQRTIKLLDGHTILIKHPAGKPIVPNSYRCIKGQGMPNRHTHSYGDLIIHFDVEFPTENFIKNESQLKQLEAILPPKRQVTLNHGERYEETEMMECEAPMEDLQEESSEYDHPQRVDCSTQ